MIERTGPVQPRKLGHVVLGSTDQAATQRFFTDGLGFKVSDEIAGIAQEELSFVVREFFLGGTVRPDESIEVSVERAGS